MNKDTIFLSGLVHLVVDGNPIKIVCEGQSIKLTFTSLKAIVTFVRSNRVLNQIFSTLSLLNCLDQLNLSYYMNDKLIGESSSSLQPSWLGRYLGLERSQFYWGPMLYSLFRA